MEENILPAAPVLLVKERTTGMEESGCGHLREAGPGGQSPPPRRPPHESREPPSTELPELHLQRRREHGAARTTAAEAGVHTLPTGPRPEPSGSLSRSPSPTRTPTAGPAPS